MTTDQLLAAHAAAWWRDIDAADFVEQVNATYADYLAAGGNDEHYDANWRALSDRAKRNRPLPMEIDAAMADARDVWLAKRAAKAAEEARMLALRLAANARSRPLPMDGSDSHEYGEE